MKFRYILLSSCILLSLSTWGQTKKVTKKEQLDQQARIMLCNKIFVDNIKTVKFHPEGRPLAEPVLKLGTSAKLVLIFDDIDLDVKNYRYSIQHYNADWTPNEELNIFDFLDGFEDEIFQDYEFSRTEYSDYVHFTLELPNDRVKWKLSGNYVLKVFDDSNDKKLVLTRRFMVTENLVFVTPDVRVAFRNDQSRSHQEIDFDVTSQKLQIQSTPEQISATVVQNGIWGSAIYGIKPLFIKQGKLEFRYQNKICFEAGKEWRFVDMRSLENRLNFVESIEELDEGFDLLVKLDQPRANKNFFNSADANGKFVIQNFDDVSFRRLGNPIQVDTTTANLDDFSEEQLRERDRINSLVEEINMDDQKRSARQQHLVGEYILTYFTLAASQPYYKGDVYVYGELSDWSISEPYKMRYNDQTLQYETELMLKQGYYNYMYAFQPDADAGSQNFTFEEVEGNWFEANNDYNVYIYYRPFGQRYDQLVGYRSFSSF